MTCIAEIYSLNNKQNLFSIVMKAETNIINRELFDCRWEFHHRKNIN